MQDFNSVGAYSTAELASLSCRFDEGDFFVGEAVKLVEELARFPLGVVDQRLVVSLAGADEIASRREN